MEEKEFNQWRKLEPEEWKIFKAQKLEKWLQPYILPKGDLEEADKKYEEFMKKIKAREKANDWLLEKGIERKGGFRAQKWFFEMLMDMGIHVASELKADIGKFDIKQPEMQSTFEVKTITFGHDTVNIKESAWYSKPSIYLIVLKACDKNYETFQFVGWLYGHEIHELDYIPMGEARGNRAYFEARLQDLNGARKMIRMLLRHSMANPFREP